jgi:hemolysin III
MGNLPAPGMALLVPGGLSFTVGVIFYVMDHTPYMHTIWHVFVLGGIVCHWVCIQFSVIPRL